MSGIATADDLISHTGAMRYLIADKGYDADAFHRRLAEKKTVPVIPGRDRISYRAENSGLGKNSLERLTEQPWN